MEAEAKPPARKRPAFREQKAPMESEIVEKTTSDPSKLSQTDRPISVSERKEERGNNHRHVDRAERQSAWSRDSNRREPERGNFSSRERHNGGGTYRGRERFSGRQDHRPSGLPVDKWKHDLYHEANRSPTPKHEEDQIAKVEALLAS